METTVKEIAIARLDTAVRARVRVTNHKLALMIN